MPSNPSTSTQSMNSAKRPRPIKSCLSCRERKLKCDREQPCGTCLGSNRSEQCSYDDHYHQLRSLERVHSTSASNRDNILVDVQSRAGSNNVNILDLESRLQRLEDLLRGQEHRPCQTSLSSQPRIFVQGIDVDPGPIRKYFGLSNTRSLIQLVG
jgi:hypothetical protein